jgi:ATP-dependent DNA helicase RecQ
MTVDATIAKMESICDRLEAALAQLAVQREKLPSPYASIREKYPNAGKPWSKQDDEELRKLFTDGDSVDDLASTLARTPKAVRLRLERLGLLAVT